MLIAWFKRQREAAILARTDADALVHENGRSAHAEARRRERASIFRPLELRDSRRDRNHWRRVARIVAAQTGA
jgi:hypothetical protein